jgi:hypothetical protein
MPQRPANGLLAWEAAIGYLRLQYRLDARLTLQAAMDSGFMAWSAYAVWGQNTEQVTGKQTFAAALRDLWSQVDRNHVIFESREAMIRRPSNYKDNEWLDQTTQIVFDQLLGLIQIALGNTWKLTVIYEPVEVADLRFHMRVITGDEGVNLMGQGATMQAACRDLLRVTAQAHIQRRTRQIPNSTSEV